MKWGIGDTMANMNTTLVSLLLTALFFVSGFAVLNSNEGTGSTHLNKVMSADQTATRGGGSLVSYWKFDEGAGQKTADSSPNYNNGTLGTTTGVESSDPTRTPFGINGSALVFDGTDDYVIIPDNDTLDMGTNPFTIGAWIKTNAFGTTQEIYSKVGVPGDIYRYGYLLNVDASGAIQFSIHTSVIYGGVGSMNVADGKWHYVIGTTDRTSFTRIFIDGMLDSLNSSGHVGPYDGGGSIDDPNFATIGQVRGYDGTLSYPFLGSIDEVRVWSRALSASEISAYYNTTWKNYLENESLEGEWLLDEGAGTLATDTSGNWNNGTLTNGPTWNIGMSGTAVRLDGVNDYIPIANEDHFDYEYTDHFSLEAWVRTTNTADDDFIMAKHQDSPPYRGFLLSIDNQGTYGAPGDGNLDFSLQNNYIGNSFIIVEGPTKLNDGIWHHVAATYNGSGWASGIELFVDGRLESKVVITDQLGGTILNDVPLTIGSRNAASVPFKGTIDEARIWSRVLSSNEVSEYYNQTWRNYLENESLAGEWKFNEGAGQWCKDTSVHNNNGTRGASTSAEATDPAWKPFGIDGSALKFDGTDDYVRIADTPNISFGNGVTDNPFAFSLWINRDNDTHNEGLMDKELFTDDHREFLFMIYSDELYLGIYDYDGSHRIAREGPDTLIDEHQWHLITAIYDGSGSSAGIRLYCDGVRIDTTSDDYGTYVALEDTNTPIKIGYVGAGVSIYQRGIIDEVRVWSRALNGSEIAGIYNAPNITTANVKSATEDVPYSVDYDAGYLDPIPKNFTWALHTNATWLSINSTTGVLSGVPSNSNVGTAWANVSLKDARDAHDWSNFTVSVENVNDPPVITTVDDTTAVEDALYSVDYDGFDIDPTSDTLTWSLKTNATWLMINSTTGVLSATPDNSKAGKTYWVNVTVSDGKGGLDWSNFTLSVANINDAPVITTVDNTTAVEDLLYGMDYDGFDIDPTSDTLTWALKTNATWLTINSTTGVMSGTPNNTQAGKTFWVNVTVSDGQGGLDWSNFTLAVTNVNDAPVITTLDDLNATEDILYSVHYNATDIDPTMDQLTWSLRTNASWLSMNSTTGVLSGKPGNSKVGAFWVNVSVSDGHSGSEWRNFTLTVSNTNDPPVISTADLTTAIEDTLYTKTYAATDIDPTLDQLTWTGKTNASWLSFNTGTKVLSGTPDNSNAGKKYWVAISVSDGNGGSDSTNFTLTVTNVNDAPVISTANVTTATEGLPYIVNYDATDIDPTADTLTWSMKTNAGWLTIATTTGILSGTPANKDVGVSWVNVSVSDGHGGIDWSNFTLTVSNVNDPPAITTTDNTTAIEDIQYLMVYHANDIDPTHDKLTWSLETNAGWLSLSISGTLSGKPWNADVGVYWVNVSVNDGNGGQDYTYFALTVVNVNDAPVIMTTGGGTAVEGVLFSLDLDAIDIDKIGDVLTWSMTTNANWLKIDPATGTLSGTPGPADVAAFSVNVSVSDGQGGSGWTAFTIEVLKDTDGDTIPDTLDTDDDGDGMPDTWESANGLNASNASDASKDPDGDGFTNLQEYQNGTDPNVSDKKAGDGGRSYLWIYIMIGADAVLLVIGLAIYMKMRKKHTRDKEKAEEEEAEEETAGEDEEDSEEGSEQAEEGSEEEAPK